MPIFFLSFDGIKDIIFMTHIMGKTFNPIQYERDQYHREQLSHMQKGVTRYTDT